MSALPGSATSELRHLLTIAPPSLADQGFARPQTHHPQDVAKNHNPTLVAHAALQALRDSGDERLLFLRTILELSSTLHNIASEEELLFHCVTGCRHVVLVHWNQRRFSFHFLERLRDYFMTLGHSLSSSRVCRLACYTTAAAFWKRGWFATEEERQSQVDTLIHQSHEQSLLTSMSVANSVVLCSKAELFTYLEALVRQQHLQQVSLFLDCLVSEFGTKSAVMYRMPLEFHKASHKSFEKEGSLQHAVQIAIAALGQAMNSTTMSSLHTSGVETCHSVVHALTTVLAWEFGNAAWDTVSATVTQNLIRPPAEWRDCVGRAEFVRAVLQAHDAVQAARDFPSSTASLAQKFRQLLLQLASLTGPIRAQLAEQREFAACLCEGTLQLLKQTSISGWNQELDYEILHFSIQMVSRLVVNFRFSLLVELPACLPILQGLNGIGNRLLMDHIQECEEAGGDVDLMPRYESRGEALALMLDAVVSLCGDTWLWYGGTETSRQSARQTLSTTIGHLYEGFVKCRTRMAVLEEHFHVSESSDLDEIRESITEIGFREDMEAIATIGRLNLSSAISCLSSLFGATIPKIYEMWTTDGGMTPDSSALLEEARLLTSYVSYLLTDSNEGESPSIPDAVLITCRDQESLATEIAVAVGVLIQLANAQSQAISRNPTNERLSPLLSQELLGFLHRWIPVYVYPVDYGASNTQNRVVREWSNQEVADQIINFCATLCVSYQCYWPQEHLVQEGVGRLLMAIAKRTGPMRSSVVKTSSFQSMIRMHCLTASLKHSTSQSDFEGICLEKAADCAGLTLPMLWGWHRLPYKDKSLVFTAALVACSDTSNASANVMLRDSLKVLHDAFVSLDMALASKRFNPDDIDVREMACFCVQLFCGAAHAIEMANCERIPQFLSNYLMQISAMMTYYASDLTLGTLLLRFFRDYAANFIALLDNTQSITLFQASAELLKRYSEIHCASRVVTRKSTVEAAAVEDQSYEDIAFALQLLIQLGTKDFIDACSSGEVVGTAPVTDVIFFGLQQILPLMTQGLLQVQTLCAQFFELVGFMMDTYPEKVGLLPNELFDSLFESLLFGMSYHDSNVAKCSLHGLASLFREHLTSQILAPHFGRRPDILDVCARRLLSEVVFQPVIIDRVEAAGMALLPLAACDLNRFSAVVGAMSNQVSDPSQQARFNAAFSKLLQPEVIAKVKSTGYEGRMNRVRFKQEFAVFVNDVNAFLVLK
jgi:hypothetical protein